jgi:hypothetical protein
MGNVDFERILAENHHYWRNMIILLVVAVIIGSFILTDQLTSTNQKELMMEFNQESLINLYQPGSLEPEKIVNELGETMYTASWEHGSQQFSTNIKYNDAWKPELIIIIRIHPEIEDLEDEVTLAIVNSFFKTKADKLDCLEGTMGKICEKVWYDGESKMSIGVFNLFAEEQSGQTMIFISKAPPSTESIGTYL